MNHTQTMGGLCSSHIRRLSGWLFALAAIVTLSASAAAQTGTITGRVSNKATGDYLRYAQVQIVGTDKATLSGEGGVYTLTNVPAGETKLSVSYTGLDNQEVTVVVPAGGSAPQDFALTSADYGDTVVLGKFVVGAGAREGNAKAIVDQKAAMNFKVVIASDAFGDIAEGNAGEFLKLMPGISLDYVANDTRQVRGRGLPSKYTSTTMDGLRVASAASGGLSRSFELEQFSMVATEQVETVKTPTADMESDGMGTNVNYKSKSGFDKQGRRVDWQINMTGNEYDLAFGRSRDYAQGKVYTIRPGFQATYSDTFAGKLGVVIAMNESNVFNEQRRSQMTYAYSSAPGAAAIEEQQTHVRNFQAQDGPKTTNRRTGAAFLDFKVNDDLMLTFRFQHNRYSNNFRNRNLVWRTAADTSSTYLTTSANPNGNLISYTSENDFVATGRTEIGGSFRDKYGNTIILNPEANYTIGRLKLTAAGSYSRSRNSYADTEHGFFNTINGLQLNTTTTGGVPQFQYRFQKPTSGDVSPAITVVQGRDPYQMTNYLTTWSAQSTASRAQDVFYTARLDGRMELDTALPAWVKSGIGTRLQVRDIHAPSNQRYLWNGGTGAFEGAANINDYLADRDYDQEGVYGQTQPQYPNLYNLYALYRDRPGLFLDTASNFQNRLLGDTNLKEQVDSAYVMGDVKINKLELTAGLRAERTRAWGRARVDVGLAETNRRLAAAGSATYATAPNLTNNTTGILESSYNYVRVRYDNLSEETKSYTNLFPNLQAKYSFSRNLLARASFSTSILRPDFNNMAPTTVINESATPDYTITLGNLGLKPEQAKNVDFGVEYYFEPVGVVSAGVFKKFIKNTHVSQTGDLRVGGVLDPRWAGIELLEGLPAAYDTANVTRTENAGDSEVQGIELAYSQQLSFLPGLFKGLGVFANYTYIDVDFPEGFVITGTSPNLFNAGLNYKYGIFDMSLKTNYQAQNILSVSTTTNEWQYQESRMTVDLNVNVKINRYFKLFLNARNLFNEPQYWTSVHDGRAFRQEEFGCNYTVGVKGSF